MPDITMCWVRTVEEKPILCPRRDACHRFTAKPTPDRQSFFMVAPFDPATGECRHYWPAETSLLEEPKR